jgi:hypothetical protein
VDFGRWNGALLSPFGGLSVMNLEYDQKTVSLSQVKIQVPHKII